MWVLPSVKIHKCCYARDARKSGEAGYPAAWGPSRNPENDTVDSSQASDLPHHAPCVAAGGCGWASVQGGRCMECCWYTTYGMVGSLGAHRPAFPHIRRPGDVVAFSASGIQVGRPLTSLPSRVWFARCAHFCGIMVGTGTQPQELLVSEADPVFP